ncbi:hypothetical protein Leryth_006286 [Lithospermum erythrorhizon]|uniref:Hexosyltransferase n=1 Tax=Lithospermum erythrorhizon TaxID=34254 RepID=A0AAV3NN25_LITER|nr:hypothetical protein Leryth_006286 [Lithospermum erythrorhizon]
MAFWRSSTYFPLLGLLSLLLLQFIPTVSASGFHANIIQMPSSSHIPEFRESPAFRNGDSCNVTGNSNDNKNIIHIVMCLDVNYIRGTIAAVLSILQHSTCPENVSFHFLAVHLQPEIEYLMKTTFPFLNFKMYHFDSSRVHDKISKSIRQALDQPLNYARIYIPDILPDDVERVIYLDSDVIVVDDIAKLWEVDLGGKVLGAPEYCHANFTRYFTETFWNDRNFTRTFEGRNPCYFNTGVMVVDVDKWRKSGSTEKVEEWMAIQKNKRIYTLGSLPPILLVFAGDIKAVDHRWNQHGLGGDNLEGQCRVLHPGPISLLHWSGKGKPWLRLDVRKPCNVDYLWAPYDLYRSARVGFEE